MPVTKAGINPRPIPKATDCDQERLLVFVEDKQDCDGNSKNLDIEGQTN